MKTKSRTAAALPVELAWSHAGVLYRVTAWPEVALQRESGGQWLSAEPTDGALAAAAWDIREPAWRRYLEYVPARERAFVAQFRFSRLEALLVVARCPALLDVLEDTPALTVFLAAHVQLRGAARPGWDEINAVFQRAGSFGLLEWLGLPARRLALPALRNLADPEIPRRFLGSLRTVLWDDGILASLAGSPVVTDLDLARHCHRLAA